GGGWGGGGRAGGGGGGRGGSHRIQGGARMGSVARRRSCFCSSVGWNTGMRSRAAPSSSAVMSNPGRSNVRLGASMGSVALIVAPLAHGPLKSLPRRRGSVTSVRACRLHRPGPVAERPLAVEDAPDPTPGPDEVLVTVAMCGICRTDLHVVEGELPSRRSPVIPGHQVVGTVVARGAGADAPPVGARVGVAWLHRTCGVCRYCRAGRGNLCPDAAFTGWSVDGGYAELVTAPATFVHLIPDGYADRDAAPLLCAGIIGYRALRLAGIADWRGARLGLYGFGAAGHIAIQIARARGADVYVCTRDRAKHRALAEELGAAWVGGPLDPPPVALDAAIVFAPAGEIVPAALAATDKGGTVVLGGVHISHG